MELLLRVQYSAAVVARTRAVVADFQPDEHHHHHRPQQPPEQNKGQQQQQQLHLFPFKSNIA
jgi:hypothetical protein